MPSVIFMGSKPGAVVALEYLVANSWTIRAVVSSATAATDWISGKSINEVAKKHGLELLFDQQELNASHSHADYVISYMYRNLVKKNTLDMASVAALNFHAGLLPKFGGWAFYNVAILENSDTYGVTCHHMDEGFDTGPICLSKSFSIDAGEETAYSLERKAQISMVELFHEFVELAETGGQLPSVPQDPDEMRYMTREEFEQLKRIPDDADSDDVDRIARAFWYPPYECAYIERNGQRFEVIPEIAKKEVAACLHRDDLDVLKLVHR